MTVNVYSAKTTEDLFQHFIENKGDRLALFTSECCQTKKIDDLTMDSIRSVFKSCFAAIGRSQSQKGTRSYVLYIQGVKKDVVISMASFPVILSVNVK